MYQYHRLSPTQKNGRLLLIHPSNINKPLIFCASIVKLSFDFLVDESFVVLEVLLDVDLEFDDIVQDLLNLRVQFLAQGVGTEGQLFESRRAVSMLSLVSVTRVRGVCVLDVSVHLALLH